MKFRSLIVVVGVLTACFAGVPANAQQALSTADVAKIQTEVNEALQNYARLLTKSDVKGVVDTVFAHPTASITPKGIVLVTPEQHTANYTKIFADLAKTQFDHTDIKVSVCVMTPTLAIASGTFRRVNKDGSTLLEGPLAYLVAKMPEGWRLATLLGVQAGKTVSCN